MVAGVTIRRAVIGAGSFDTKNIPSRVIAVGNPCRMIRATAVSEKNFNPGKEKLLQN